MLNHLTANNTTPKPYSFSRFKSTLTLLVIVSSLLSACSINRLSDTSTTRKSKSSATIDLPDTFHGMDQDLPAIPPQSISHAAPLLSSGNGATLAKTTWSALPAWKNENFKTLWPSFIANCQAILKRGIPPASAPVPWVNPQVWKTTCQAAQSVNSKSDYAILSFFEKNLDPWQVSISNGTAYQGLITGYYEPLLRVSRQRGGEFQWPLFGVPKDLITVDISQIHPELKGKRVKGKMVGNKVVPYDTRAELNARQNSLPILAWADNPIDAFFLQVQGSGRILIANGAETGKIARLAYADHNGHTYVSIGKWLVENKELTLSQASMQGIKAWAEKNPHRVQEMLNANPAMVFFKEEKIINPNEGPKGSFATPLTGQRAIAVDPSWVALGTPIYLATTLPSSTAPMQAMVFAQDTGSAIKGPGRADFFWGSGALAGEYAGKMKQAGKTWLLWPKGQTPKFGS